MSSQTVLPRQICVWQSIPFRKQHAHPKECLKLLELLGYRANFCCYFDVQDSADDSRVDVFFEIHKDDVLKFAVERFHLFDSSQGTLFGIMFKESFLSVEQQVEFFRGKNLDSFALFAEFEKFAVFSVQLFDAAIESEEEQENMAILTCKKLLDATKLYEAEFSSAKKIELFRCGHIRWWEDVVRNLKESLKNIYGENVLQQFAPQWE